MPNADNANISKLLSQCKEQILQLWEGKVAKTISKTRNLTTPALRDSLPALLDIICECVLVQSEEQVREAAKKCGIAHARLRAIYEEFTLEEIIEEYHLFRISIFEVVCDQIRIPAKIINIILDIVYLAVQAANREFSAIHKLLVQASEERLSDSYLQAPMGVAILLGPEYIFKIANDAYLKMTGKTSQEVLSKPLRMVYPDIKDRSLEIIESVYKDNKPFVGRSYPALLPRDGKMEQRYLDFLVNPICNSSGEVYGVFSVTIDVTEQTIAQSTMQTLTQELKHAVEARDNFMGIASHELKTPLTSLKLQTQMNQKILEQKGIYVFTPEKLKKIFDNTAIQAE